MADDRTKHDLEHYIRLAQDILDEGASRIGRSLVDPIRERPSVDESEYVSRVMSSAARLAHDLSELATWLEMSMGRKAGVTGGKRGRERFHGSPP